MTKSQLVELIDNRETSGVEFKRDDVRSEQLVKEIVAPPTCRAGVCCWASKTMAPSPKSSASAWSAR